MRSKVTVQCPHCKALHQLISTPHSPNTLLVMHCSNCARPLFREEDLAIVRVMGDYIHPKDIGGN